MGSLTIEGGRQKIEREGSKFECKPITGSNFYCVGVDSGGPVNTDWK